MSSEASGKHETYVAVEGARWHVVKAWRVDTKGFAATAVALCGRELNPDYENDEPLGPACRRCEAKRG